MPEQITKYPDVTLKVLQGAGARCGEGIEPRILTRCPPERFCSLPSGEICVYGIADIPKMTQIKPAELARVVCPSEKASDRSASLGGPEALALTATFVLGLAIGGVWRRLRRPS